MFYGTESRFNLILEEVEITKSDIILTRISQDENLDLIEKDKVKGIIDNFNDIKDENLDTIFKLKLKGLVVESLLTWVENEFHRILYIVDNNSS